MSDSQFVITEKEIACTLIIEQAKIKAVRNKLLKRGVDWERWVDKDKRIKYTKEAVEKITQHLQVLVLPKPVLPDKDLVVATVLRCNYENPTLVLADVIGHGQKFVRINPLWRHLFLPQMKIEVTVDGQGNYSTRKPRWRGRF